ncbi:hypothetical protein OROHE_026100 [Orobanche hederae]
MWRACMNLIPTMGNLKEQHMPVAGECPPCFDRWAATEHMLLFCPKMRDFWKRSGFCRILRKGVAASFAEIAEAMQQEVEEEEYENWSVMVWKVWGHVCEEQHRDGKEMRGLSIDECRSLWLSYQKSKVIVDREMSLGVVCGAKTWKRPPEGVYRVDVNALYDENSLSFGVGVVVRDWNGKVRIAMSNKTKRRANVMIAEMMAVVEGIIVSLKHGFEVISIFTDSLLAARIMAVDEEIDDLVPDDVGKIIREAKGKNLVGVYHMYRSANKVAHTLAGRSTDYENEMVWCDCIPPWLRIFVPEDASA